MTAAVPFQIGGAAALLERAGSRGTRHVVGIGEFAVSKSPDDALITHALGSCIAVCIFDHTNGVGGLLHFLLPDASINPERAKSQPAAFANSGLPLLFQSAYSLGLDKKRCRVRLIGGAEVARHEGTSTLNVGKRNLLAARNILWKNGLLVESEATGGSAPRSVSLHMSDGTLNVMSGRDLITAL